MNKKITKGLALGLILATSMTFAYAAGTQQEIKAIMDSGVTVEYEGIAQKLVDVNGVTKSPIMYNGTTYVPVRSIADIFKKGVEWDDETRTVLLSDTLKANVETDSLEKIMEAIYSGVESDLPRVGNIELDDSNVKYYLGIDSLNGAEAIASEAMINAIAHSVVLVRAQDGTDIEALKKEIKEKVDPRKWVCVGVDREEVIVDNIGNLVIMIINDSISQEIYGSFLRLNEN